MQKIPENFRLLPFFSGGLFHKKYATRSGNTPSCFMLQKLGYTLARQAICGLCATVLTYLPTYLPIYTVV